MNTKREDAHFASSSQHNFGMDELSVESWECTLIRVYLFSKDEWKKKKKEEAYHNPFYESEKKKK